MKCSVCGRENMPGAHFCETCGSPLPKSAVVARIVDDGYENTNDLKTKYTKDALLKHAPVVFFVVQILYFFSNLLVFMDLNINQGARFDFDFFARLFDAFKLGYLTLGILIFVFMKKRNLVGVLVMLIINLFLYVPLCLINIGADLSQAGGAFIGKLISDYYLSNIIPVFVNILVIVFNVLVITLSDKPWMKYRKVYAVIPAGILFVYNLSRIVPNLRWYISSIFAFLPEFLEVLGVFILTYWIAGYNTVTRFYAPWYSRPKGMYADDHISSYVCRLRDRVIISGRFGTFLAAVILVTLSVFVQLSRVNEGFVIFNALEGLADIFNIPVLQYFSYAMSGLLSDVEISLVAVKLVMLIPPVLTVIGLWLIFGSVRGSSYNLSLAAVGCKMIKVVEIIVCVVKSLFWGAVCMIAMDMSSNRWGSNELFGAAALVAVITIIICIVKCVAVCKSLNAALDAATGDYVRDLSKFIVFVCVVGGIADILLSGFGLVGILDGAASILFALTASLFINSGGINDLPDEDYI